MQKKSSNDISYLRACEEIANDILTLDINNPHIKKEIFSLIKKKSSKYKLSKIPKNVDILKLLPEDNNYKKLLKLKPSKTSSGIAVITVMPMPFECPHGKCIYCPGGIEVNTPLSYVGTEPATKIAQHANYDPFRQIWSKVIQLLERGHSVDKAELVIVGGTFPFYPIKYQKDFVKKCYDAFNLFDSHLFNYKNNDNLESIQNDLGLNFELIVYLEKAKKNNEKSNIRCVGLTIETKPDYCKKEHIDIMLELGTTRIEIGVQSLSDEVYKAINRGHTLSDVYEGFYLAKNCGYKIAAHMMPGLPKSSINKDIEDFKKLFEDEKLRPDMLKIYPTLVIKNTGLYKLYQEKKYNSYSTEDLVRILVEVKKIIPPWTRIMRIQREIESDDIVSGPKMGNLRQLVLKELDKQGVKCKCIRCREIGLKDLKNEFSSTDIKLNRTDYLSSNGKEIFLSFESNDNNIIFGFLRLRIMSDPQRNELKENNGITEKESNGAIITGKKILSGVVRELHVYGPLAKIGFKSTENNALKRKGFIYQHKGLGQNLLKEAEKICKQEYNLKKLSVISAIGTREYYKKFGYVINGPYVTKAL
ncbi:MAG: tRNA uridine(34) 5-carboxymethylaminomethyl modification radical SAM/GNAT enzyme Elp3 [Nitrosopumilus sp.]|nr:tRNA uridine(34) 5-carboxymethylaminomethyl modification radical SAM/GNAT enzyme Elp3 [Nitrosopumilus sp.]